MSDITYATEAIQAVLNSKASFFKFISSNDSGETGGHQAGILIPKPAVPVIFPRLFPRGKNESNFAEIVWEDGFVTQSRFIYYGQGTRDEYRVTNFGREFDYRSRIETGNLFVLTRNSQDYSNFSAFILKDEESMEEFLAAFSLSPVDAGRIIHIQSLEKELTEETEFYKFATALDNEFPNTILMSQQARIIFDKLYNKESEVRKNPDKRLIEWTEIEYRLFRYIENYLFIEQISEGFSDIDDFIVTANSILNRRKSRAGKSLENQLEAIFTGNLLNFTSQARTERYSRPDFLFPSEEAYKNPKFPKENLIFLAAKTTCKDRWRQILTEADKIEKKYLFTLQQGISSQQLQEMEFENVQLVVPARYHKDYPEPWRKRILSLKEFIDYVKLKNQIMNCV
jgi:hypothetical protein